MLNNLVCSNEKTQLDNGKHVQGYIDTQTVNDLS